MCICLAFNLFVLFPLFWLESWFIAPDIVVYRNNLLQLVACFWPQSINLLEIVSILDLHKGWCNVEFQFLVSVICMCWFFLWLLVDYGYIVPYRVTPPPLFFAKLPLKSPNCRSPPFLGNPPLYIGFSWTPPMKIRFFSKLQKY